MLYIWTGAKADVLRKALDDPFSRIEDVPDHQVIPFEENTRPDAEAGDVVLVMGSKTLGELQRAGIARKGRTVTSLRQTAIYGPKGEAYLTTLDPFMVRTQADAPSLIAQDVALACRLATTGSLEPKMGEYRYVEDFSELLERARERVVAEGAADLAVDLETIGLFPEAEGARIVTIQMSIYPGFSDVYYVPEDGKLPPLLRKQITKLLTEPKLLVCGANFKFDWRWIMRHWEIDCTNFSADTCIIGSIISENRSNSLKTHAWEYTNMGGYEHGLDEKGYDKGRFDLIPKHDLLPYAGGDTDVTIRSARKMKKELAKQGECVRLYRKVIHPASRGFAQMEHEGVLVDVPRMVELRQELSDHIADCDVKMVKMLPGRLKAKYADNLSLTRPALIRDFFFSPLGLNLRPKQVTEKSGEASTAKTHLMMFADDERAKPFTDLLAERNSADKTKSSFVDSFLNALRTDGRLHPSYQLFVGTMYEDDSEDSGAVTGRTSCKDPAFQTIPSKTKWAKKLRACYPAIPGHVIIQLDFSQGELKVVACVAEEDNMIAAFKKGLDLHSVTASAFMGISYEAFLAMETTDPFTWKFTRTGAKAGNFGLLYGMKAPGFQIYARNNYGVAMTMDEAETRRDQFFELYPGLLQYHEDAVDFVRKHGYIESPLGHRRHLPLIDSPDQKAASDARRQGINAPIQSTLNHLAFFALPRMQAAVPEAKFFGMIHDSLLAYIPADTALETAIKLRDIMSNLPLKKEMGWDHQLQFTADAEYGPLLSELKKVA